MNIQGCGRLGLRSSLNYLAILVLLGSLGFVFAVRGAEELFDKTFGAAGEWPDGEVYAILVQPDGKIMLGGGFENVGGHSVSNLCRLSGDGELDHSFGLGTDGEVYRLLQQPDGKTLVAGSFDHLQGVAKKHLGRLLTNGVVDVEFDAGSLFGDGAAAFSLALQPDGKILVGSILDNRLYRLSPDGQLDSSFIQTNAFDDYHAFDILVRTNGSILVGGGFSGVNGFPTPGLALLSSNGRLNTNFHSCLMTNWAIFPSTVTSFADGSNGSVVVGGVLWKKPETNRAMIAKLDPNLSWDSSFQPDPVESISQSSYATKVLVQSDGKIILAGYFSEVGGYCRRNVVRLDAAGHVDPCFDPGLGLAGFMAYTAVRQNDGRILVGGDFVTWGSATNIVRLLPQGDCNPNHVYLNRTGPDEYSVAATCGPGGNNLFQASSNLVDWITTDSSTTPYFIFQYHFSTYPAAFFRIKKE